MTVLEERFYSAVINKLCAKRKYHYDVKTYNEENLEHIEQFFEESHPEGTIKDISVTPYVIDGEPKFVVNIKWYE